MKNPAPNRFAFLTITLAVALLVACKAPAPEDTAEQPLTATEKTEIEAAVMAVLDIMVEGMNEHDVDKILSVYQKSDHLLYSGEGNLVVGWDDLYAMANDSHSDPANASARHSIDNVTVDVLNRDLALLTASGYLTRTDEEGTETSRGYSLTDVLTREDGKWLVINEHESLECPTPTE